MNNLFLFSFSVEMTGQVHNLFFDPGLVEEDDLLVDVVLHEVLDRPHREHLLGPLMADEDGEDVLQAGDAVLGRGVGAPQEVGEEDEVVLLAGLDEADLLEERGQAVEDGGGQPGEEGETLDQEVVTLLQAGDGLYDGSDQPDLVVLDFSRDESSSGLPKFVALKYLITTNACNYVLAYKKISEST